MTLKERFDAKWQENPETGCWDWTASTAKGGYGKIRVAGKLRTAHRASYELHVGPIPDGFQVCHQCDRPCCVNPAHLFLGTNADNVRDKVQKCRQAKPKGEESGRAKLTSEEVKLMRAAADRLPHGGGKFLARWFGVSDRTIKRIKRGKSWTHV